MVNKNRVISIALAMCLLGESIPAKAFSIRDMFMFDGYSNSTSAGTWQNPVTGAHYMYGGSYTFKFKRGNSYTPWIQFEAPSYKVGCNGISLKGGFIALLGLDDIQAQLQDAGAAFAWGIVIGLVYSLPGVATAFKFIREWATTIQKLLQNACNIGQALGRYASDKFASTVGAKDLSNALSESAIGKGFADAKKVLESASGELEHIRTEIDKIANNPEEVINGSKKKDLAAALGSDILKKAAGSSASVTGAYLSSISSDSGAEAKAGFIKSSLAEAFNGNIAGIRFRFPDNKQTEILLMLTFFGDVGVNNATLEKLSQLFNEGGGINKEAFKNIAMSTRHGKGVTIIDSPITIPPVVKDAKLAAKALMYGFSNATGACPNSSGDFCQVPNYTVALIAFGENVPSMSSGAGGDNGIATSIPSLKTVKNFILNDTPNGTISLQWAGFYQESLNGINQLVNNIKNGRAGGATGINAPLLLPNIMKYANIIANIEKKSGGVTPYTTHLKEMVARNNAYFAAQFLANMLEQSVLELLKGNHSNITDEAHKNLTNFLKSVQDRKEAILEQIREDKKNDIDIEKLATLFQRIETENKIESIKLIR